MRPVRFKLPPDIEDGILNRTQLAVAFRVSENTITKWVSRGMPVEEEGDNGRAYSFLLSDCWAWREGQRAEADRIKTEGDRIAAQAAQAFLNLGADEDARSEMSPREVKEWAEAEIKRAEAARRRGDYTLTVQVEELLEGILVDFRKAIISLPDFAERELGLSLREVKKLESWSNGALEEAQRLIEENRLGEAEVSEFRAAQGDLL